MNGQPLQLFGQAQSRRQAHHRNTVEHEVSALLLHGQQHARGGQCQTLLRGPSRVGQQWAAVAVQATRHLLLPSGHRLAYGQPAAGIGRRNGSPQAVALRHGLLDALRIARRACALLMLRARSRRRRLSVMVRYRHVESVRGRRRLGVPGSHALQCAPQCARQLSGDRDTGVRRIRVGAGLCDGVGQHGGTTVM
ncbi:hypothetical protein [Ralstonia sp. TCR112]|uniref:hypothetical protein n=1 Tax=Ralstonia sp. TCR112 TaxID=2601730 RepID=UPI0021C39850|nr:hypothetical protein [Ralstonia sp. TCR112]